MARFFAPRKHAQQLQARAALAWSAAWRVAVAQGKPVGLADAIACEAEKRVLLGA